MAVHADYRFAVDWEGDNVVGLDGTFDAMGTRTFDDLGTMTFDETITLLSTDDVTSDVRHSPATAIGRGRDQAREFAPPISGLCDFALENADARYSSANVAGPLYGQLRPGKLVEVAAYYDDVRYPLFQGHLDLPTEQPARLQQRVRFGALDGLAKLVAHKNVSTAMYTSLRTDQAIAHVLDAAGWPADKRVLDTGKTTLARWWVDGIDAFTAVRDLMYTEGPGALVFIDEEGNFVFQSRHWRLLDPLATTVQATFRGRTTEPLYRRFEYEPGLRGIVNACTVPVRSYAVAALAPIWTGPTPLTLAPGEVWTRTVTTTADGFEDALMPAAGTDYTVTAGALAGVVLSRTSGKRATLTLTGGASGATLTGLQVRGETVTISQTEVSETVDATDSWEAYGVREFPSSYIPKWIPTANEALDFCNAVVSRYKEPVPQVRFSVTNGHEARLIQALSLQMSTRVRVIEDERAMVDDEFTIEAISHLITEGQNHETTFSAEQASSQVYWVLGVPGYSELGETTVLGY
jgi:hypothetical protein